MKIFIKLMIIFFACNLYAMKNLQIIPVEPSVEPENVKIYIVLPEKGEMQKDNEVWAQLRLRGFPLGNITDLERASEIVNSELGQSIHVVIDNNPYFARVGPSLGPFDDEGNYYEAMYRFKIPYPLSQGQHFIRVFPARSYAESLKDKNCFAASYFFVQNKKINEEMDLSKPYITFSEPSGYLELTEKKPVLLDFYVTNCILSKNGYRVKVTIDDKAVRILTMWTPYYIYGLKKGKHTINLQLIGKDSKKVEGFFNDVTRNFNIY